MMRRLIKVNENQIEAYAMLRGEWEPAMGRLREETERWGTL